ncbi:hypothetical protein L9F63_026299, partial [Diploptera punctata]
TLKSKWNSISIEHLFLFHWLAIHLTVVLISAPSVILTWISLLTAIHMAVFFRLLNIVLVFFFMASNFSTLSSAENHLLFTIHTGSLSPLASIPIWIAVQVRRVLSTRHLYLNRTGSSRSISSSHSIGSSSIMTLNKLNSAKDHSLFLFLLLIPVIQTTLMQLLLEMIQILTWTVMMKVLLLLEVIVAILDQM